MVIFRIRVTFSLKSVSIGCVNNKWPVTQIVGWRLNAQWVKEMDNNFMGYETLPREKVYLHDS